MVLCIIGSVTTWSNLYGIGVSGWEGDGKITMGVAVIALVFLVVGALTKARWPFIVSLILTVVAGGIFLYYIVDLASPAFGLYIGIAGAFIGLLGSILGISIRRA